MRQALRLQWASCVRADESAAKPQRAKRQGLEGPDKKLQLCRMPASLCFLESWEWPSKRQGGPGLSPRISFLNDNDRNLQIIAILDWTQTRKLLFRLPLASCRSGGAPEEMCF